MKTMQIVCEILIFLLFLNGVFGSVKDVQQSDVLTLQNSQENVAKQMTNAAASERVFETTTRMRTNEEVVPLKMLVNQEQTKEHNLTSAEHQALVNLNSADKVTEIGLENSSETMKEQVTSKPLLSSEMERNLTASESGLVDVVLKNLTNLESNHLEVKDTLKKSFESPLNVSSETSMLLSLEKVPSTNLTEVNSERIILQHKRYDEENSLPHGKELQGLQSSKDFTVQELSKTIAKSAESNIFQNLSLLLSEIDSKIELPGLASSDGKENVNEKDPGHNSSDEFVIDDNAKSRNEYKISTKPLDGLGTMLNSNFPENAWVQIVLKDGKSLSNKQETSDVVSPAEESSTSTTTTKPFVTLEEYAVKQMNFILDHLLLETQEFVSKVLQASLNSVFPRDNLKRYAEDLNRVLNPDSNGDSSYSDEFVVEPQITNQDQIYEEIVAKLNFLKSKSSRHLQKCLPQEWIRDFFSKKSELGIWLDKATEEMHREFNLYVTEEEDRIKYQYFNETFDDISRATEIHHKLALLADLVKIVKNKKQITFMDLYMQT